MGNRRVRDQSCSVPALGTGMLKAPVSSHTENWGCSNDKNTATGELSLPLCLDGEKTPLVDSKSPLTTARASLLSLDSQREKQP